MKTPLIVVRAIGDLTHLRHHDGRPAHRAPLHVLMGQVAVEEGAPATGADCSSGDYLKYLDSE